MAVPTSLKSRITLNDGNKMPMFGLGTFQLVSEGEAEKTCRAALKCGYRLLDTATMYQNEAEVGAAVRKSGLARKDVFVTTKLIWDDHGADKAREAIEKSLKLLNLGYIDLYLIHSPIGGQILETYDVLVEYQKKGLLKSIGVSNFTVEQLTALAAAGRPTPAVNQLELNCWYRQGDIVTYCREHGIVVHGYSPNAMGRNGKLEDPVLKQIAQRLRRSPAQVAIRWSVQRGFITIPKTCNARRLVENTEVFSFSLTGKDMAALNNLKESTCMPIVLMGLEWLP